MKRFLKTLIIRPVTICTLIVILLFMGIIAISDMSINLLPNMNMPMIGITIIYPGASADTVEQDVTTKLENELRAINGINSISTYSIDNASIAILEFEFETNIDKKIADIEKKFSTLSLPSECEKPSITTIDLNGDAVASITLYNSGENLELINEQAKILQSLLYSIEGVGSIKLIGAPEVQVKITSLEGLDISTLLIIEALSTDNLDIPLGTIMEDGKTVSIRNASNATSIEDLANIPIKLTLPINIFNTLINTKNIIKKYEECKLDELENVIQQALDLKEIIKMMETDDVETLEKFQSNIIIIKALMQLINNNSVVTLNLIWNNLIQPLITSDVFLTLTDEQLQEIANQYQIDKNILKWLQDNSGPDGGNILVLWERIISFKQVFSQDNELITYEDFAILFTDGGKITKNDGTTVDIEGINIFDESYSPSEVNQIIEIADKINLIALSTIIDNRKNNNEITNEQFALLFLNISGGIINQEILSSEIIGIIRDEYFNDNCQILIDYKKKHVDENGLPIDLNGDLVIIGQNQIIFTDDELLSLYNSLLIQNNDFKVSLDLINFIRNTNFDNIITEDSNGVLIISLGKISKIESKTILSSHAKYNDTNSIIVEVYANAGANTTRIVKEIKSILNTNPFSCHVKLLDDKAEFINDSIGNVVSSLIIGGVLAIIVIYLFIRKIRSSLIIAISLPLSVIVALLGLWSMNISLNMVSLGGLAVGIGMLVDNSIVVLESITKKRGSGEKVFDSAYKGTLEVSGSLLASTLTNLCVFFPILFMKGMTKEIFSDLVYAVLFSMIMSLIVAIIVIPTLYYLVYKHEDTDKHLLKKQILSKPSKTDFMEKGEKWYGKTIGKLLKHRFLICIFAFSLFSISIVLVFTTGTEFLPSIDKGLIEVNINYSNDATIKEANEYANNFINEVNKINGIEYVSVKVGTLNIIDTNISSVIRIQIEPNTQSTSEVVQKIRKIQLDNQYIQSIAVSEIDGVVAEITSGFSNLSASIQGEDYEQLKKINLLVKERLLLEEGFVSVIPDTSEMRTEYNYTFNREKCLEYGVDYSMVIMLLRSGIASYDVTTIKVDDNNAIVNVSFSDNTTSSIESINNIIVGFYQNQVIKIKDLCVIKETQTNGSIKRYNNKYQASLNIETSGIDTGTASKVIKKVVNEVLKDFEGYEYVEGGVTVYLNDAFSGLVIALIIAFFLLYGVMAYQFESFIKPLVVIMSIPFALTGGFLALFITNTSLNIVSFIGLIMLMGVIVNGAIVMVDKIDLLIKEGMSPFDAVIEGSSSRLRAILMTTLTTILALIPISFGLGSGGELMQPMGIVVLGGLLLGTLVTLILIPCFYCIVKNIKSKL